MDERNLKQLYDIHEAIAKIESYFIEHPKDFKHYQSNTLLKRAVERDLEIIGEAVNRILKKDLEFPIEYAKRIVGLRNQIIHAYDSISDENIRAIISKHIPNLKEEVLKLIEKSEQDTTFSQISKVYKSKQLGIFCKLLSRQHIYMKKMRLFQRQFKFMKMENILKIAVKNYKNKFDVANAMPSRGEVLYFLS